VLDEARRQSHGHGRQRSVSFIPRIPTRLNARDFSMPFVNPQSKPFLRKLAID